MTKVAVIGSGISGITLARQLDNWADVVVFEKSKVASGRMAHRKSLPYHFDHGAQYFTARTEVFRNLLAPLIDSNVVKRWDARYVKFDHQKKIAVEKLDWSDDEPRYVGVPGMNAVVHHLSKGINIHFGRHINSIQRAQKWVLVDSNGAHHEDFDWVISTAPAPQTAKLMPLEFSHVPTVTRTQMRPCLALMVGFNQKLNLDFDAAHVINSNISWIALNSSKPGRPSSSSLVIHSSESYAQTRIEDDENIITKDILRITSNIIGQDITQPQHVSLHRWRYANNAKRTKLPVLIDRKNCLAACGDWCLGGRVEGGFIAAVKLAHSIMKKPKA